MRSGLPLPTIILSLCMCVYEQNVIHWEAVVENHRKAIATVGLSETPRPKCIRMGLWEIGATEPEHLRNAHGRRRWFILGAVLASRDSFQCPIPDPSASSEPHLDFLDFPSIFLFFLVLYLHTRFHTLFGSRCRGWNCLWDGCVVCCSASMQSLQRHRPKARPVLGWSPSGRQ